MEEYKRGGLDHAVKYFFSSVLSELEEVSSPDFLQESYSIMSNWTKLQKIAVIHDALLFWTPLPPKEKEVLGF